MTKKKRSPSLLKLELFLLEPEAEIQVNKAVSRFLNQLPFNYKDLNTLCYELQLNIKQIYNLFTIVNQHLDISIPTSWISKHINLLEEMNPSKLDNVEALRKDLEKVHIPAIKRRGINLDLVSESLNGYIYDDYPSFYGLSDNEIKTWGFPPFFNSVENSAEKKIKLDKRVNTATTLDDLEEILDSEHILGPRAFYLHFNKLLTPLESRELYYNSYSFLRGDISRKFLYLPMEDSALVYDRFYMLFRLFNDKMNKIEKQLKLKGKWAKKNIPIHQIVKDYNDLQKGNANRIFKIEPNLISEEDIKLLKTKYKKIQFAKVMFLSFPKIRHNFRSKASKDYGISDALLNITKNIKPLRDN